MVRFSDAATLDLTNIRDWIAKDIPARAVDKIELIIEACQLLERQPGMGRPYIGNVMYFTKRPWIIVYSLAAKDIQVQRIFDSRQDWRALLTQNV